MHEYSLIQSLVDRVEAEARAREATVLLGHNADAHSGALGNAPQQTA